MKLVLPPGHTEASLNAALKAFAGVVGDKFVFSTDQDRDTYLIKTGADTNQLTVRLNWPGMPHEAILRG